MAPSNLWSWGISSLKMIGFKDMLADVMLILGMYFDFGIHEWIGKEVCTWILNV